MYFSITNQFCLHTKARLSAGIHLFSFSIVRITLNHAHRLKIGRVLHFNRMPKALTFFRTSTLPLTGSMVSLGLLTSQVPGSNLSGLTLFLFSSSPVEPLTTSAGFEARSSSFKVVWISASTNFGVSVWTATSHLPSASSLDFATLTSSLVSGSIKRQRPWGALQLPWRHWTNKLGSWVQILRVRPDAYLGSQIDPGRFLFNSWESRWVCWSSIVASRLKNPL